MKKQMKCEVEKCDDIAWVTTKREGVTVFVCDHCAWFIDAGIGDEG